MLGSCRSYNPTGFLRLCRCALLKTNFCIDIFTFEHLFLRRLFNSLVRKPTFVWLSDSNSSCGSWLERCAIRIAPDLLGQIEIKLNIWMKSGTRKNWAQRNDQWSKQSRAWGCHERMRSWTHENREISVHYDLVVQKIHLVNIWEEIVSYFLSSPPILVGEGPYQANSP